MPRPNVSLTFPCYNEEANVGPMIEAAITALDQVAAEREIIVSNDGSRDATSAIAHTYAEKYPDIVRVIDAPVNRGYGHALRSGLQAARFEWVFFTDGDRQFDLAEMSRLVPFLPDHDIVTGYRSARQDPFHRKLNSWGWNLVGRVLLGIRVRDVNCAFRFYRKSFLDAIAIESEGAMINQEIYAKAYRMNMRIREVEVTHLPRTAGTPTGGDPRVIVRAFRELFALRSRLK